MTTVRDHMTADPVYLESSATIRDAARAMRDHNFGSVPVVEGGALVGMLTDRDIVIRAVADGAGAESPISAVMSGDVVTVGVDDDLEEVRRTLSSHALRRVPVVDGESLVGILALGDLAEGGEDEKVLKDISEAAPDA